MKFLKSNQKTLSSMKHLYKLLLVVSIIISGLYLYNNTPTNINDNLVFDPLSSNKTKEFLCSFR